LTLAFRFYGKESQATETVAALRDIVRLKLFDSAVVEEFQILPGQPRLKTDKTPKVPKGKADYHG
jgi:hypothetical protein